MGNKKKKLLFTDKIAEPHRAHNERRVTWGLFYTGAALLAILPDNQGSLGYLRE